MDFNIKSITGFFNAQCEKIKLGGDKGVKDIKKTALRYVENIFKFLSNQSENRISSKDVSYSKLSPSPSALNSCKSETDFLVKINDSFNYFESGLINSSKNKASDNPDTELLFLYEKFSEEISNLIDKDLSTNDLNTILEKITPHIKMFVDLKVKKSSCRFITVVNKLLNNPAVDHDLKSKAKLAMFEEPSPPKEATSKRENVSEGILSPAASTPKTRIDMHNHRERAQFINDCRTKLNPSRVLKASEYLDLVNSAMDFMSHPDVLHREKETMSEFLVNSLNNLPNILNSRNTEISDLNRIKNYLNSLNNRAEVSHLEFTHLDKWLDGLQIEMYKKTENKRL